MKQQIVNVPDLGGADSVEVIEQYLDKARETLAALPDGAGLASLTDYLSRQTERLGACA